MQVVDQHLGLHVSQLMQWPRQLSPGDQHHDAGGADAEHAACDHRVVGVDVDDLGHQLAHPGIPSLREVKMFGGLSFMVDGHIVAFASRSGDMMVRCPPEDEARLLAEAGDTAQQARIGNRKQQQKTTGWITVRADALTEPVFDRWLDIALDYNQRP